MKGYVMQLQPFSVNDGDGIRTTVFLAGCPLRCRWCANPEGFGMTGLTGWYQNRCIGCGACHSICPEGIGIDLNAERDKCTGCGLCADACPADSRTRMVSLMDADDVIKQIHRHRLFYSYSGGGVTFSGGEATAQTDFLDCLSERLYDMGYSMDLETCGLFDWNKTVPILARMDLIFMDLKMMDASKHLEYTGVSNEKILDNMAKLASLDGPETVIRIPVIGGVNDDAENIRSSAAYVRDHVPGAKMELLPYHRYGTVKYAALGMPYDHPEFTVPDKAAMGKLRQIVQDEGVELTDFR